MLLLIDNYDSFTFNLSQYLGELGAEIRVARNDEIDLKTIAAMKPSHIVISPGPCTPNEAGLSNEIVLRFGPEVPLLGVCLGHQCIGAAYGAVVERSPELMHGKTSMIHHDGDGLFQGVPTPFEATRYHSLIVRDDSIPRRLARTAWTQEGLVMGLRHRDFPVFGVQFHPESILTGEGKRILANFLALEPSAGGAKTRGKGRSPLL
ncbi:aminodeoxychorismate/anthranilate synthase component II [Candidatus Sumerlaeota bacterium]|nr:aminodeoxychorismate/anthranilate synthase component II [Candidatus Sumerlaeota bacterium]